MSHRTIDTTIHDLSGPQVLENLLRLFREDPHERVVLFTHPDVGQAFIQNLRVKLTRNRQAQEREGVKTTVFGFVVESGPQRYNIGGVLKDGYALKFRMTQLQQMRNMAKMFEGITL